MIINKINVFWFFITSIVTSSGVATVDVTYSPTLGMERIDFDAHEESFFGLSLTTQETWLAKVASYSNGSVTLDREVSASGNLSVEAKSGDPQFYIIVKTGPMAGAVFSIESNSGSVLNLVGGSSSVLDHPLYTSSSDLIGQLVNVKPFWTIKSIFEGEDILSETAKNWLKSKVEIGDGDVFSFLRDSRLGTLESSHEVYSYNSSMGWKSASSLEDMSFSAFEAGDPVVFINGSPTHRELYVLGAVSKERFIWEFPSVLENEWGEFYRSIPTVETKVLSSLEASLFMTTSEGIRVRTDDVVILPMSNMDEVTEDYYYLMDREGGGYDWVSVSHLGKSVQSNFVLLPGNVYRFRIKGPEEQHSIVFE